MSKGSPGYVVAMRSIFNDKSRVSGLMPQLFGIVCNIFTTYPREPVKAAPQFELQQRSLRAKGRV